MLISHETGSCCYDCFPCYCGSNILAILAAPHGSSGSLLVLWCAAVPTEVLTYCVWNSVCCMNIGSTLLNIQVSVFWWCNDVCDYLMIRLSESFAECVRTDLWEKVSLSFWVLPVIAKMCYISVWPLELCESSFSHVWNFVYVRQGVVYVDTKLIPMVQSFKNCGCCLINCKRLFLKLLAKIFVCSLMLNWDCVLLESLDAKWIETRVVIRASLRQCNSVWLHGATPFIVPWKC